MQNKNLQIPFKLSVEFRMRNVDKKLKTVKHALVHLNQLHSNDKEVWFKLLSDA